MAKYYTRHEAKQRRLKLQIFAGMFDFISTIIGILVIAACIVLLTSLVSWIISDGQVTFKTAFECIARALDLPQ